MTRPSILFWYAIVLSLTTIMASDGLVQAPSKPPVRPQPTAVRAPGAPEAASQRSLDSAYMRLLERTNQQLSLWWSPYGVMVATLGALFAVLAIVAAILIFRQGREYRTLITRSIGEYQGILNAFIEEKNREVELMNKRITGAIDRATKDLETAKGAQKGEIEKEISELKKLKETLKPHEQPKFFESGAIGYSTQFPVPLASSLSSVWGVSPSPYLMVTNIGRSHTCAKCARQYVPPAQTPGTITVGGRLVTCPNCGNVERVSDF
jgi:hypothetical protein